MRATLTYSLSCARIDVFDRILAQAARRCTSSHNDEDNQQPSLAHHKNSLLFSACLSVPNFKLA
jgi:hypothetical protein